MKKMLFSVAMIAAVLSSCSKNELRDTPNPNENPNAIGLSTGIFATKAETTTTSLQTSCQTGGNTIVIHSTETTKLDNLTFTYDGAKWKQTGTEKTWEGVDFTVPIPIYSLNDGVASVDLDPASGASGKFTVQSAPADHRDLIYYGQELAGIPSGSNIQADFRHALSRIVMTNLTADEVNKIGSKVLALVNLDGAGVPTITPSNVGGSVAWSTPQDNTSYTYDNSNDMYVIPQTLDYVSAEDGTIADTDSHITATYFNVGIGVGYASAADYINANEEGTTVTDASGTAYTGAMYRKVAFKINDQILAVGKYYNFQLNFGGTNLIYVDNKWYDKDGNLLTTNGDDGGGDPEGPVNPDASDVIGLEVDVIHGWGTATDASI